MPFSKLLGNETAKFALQQMLEQKKIPHALLFCGPEGVGKGQFALAFVKHLLGEKGQEKLASGNHPDVHILHPEGKAALHPIENIRAMIQEASLPPFEAPVKIFILHGAHQMLPTSSNALLKTLEEPVPNTYFILITEQPDALLPTLLSRMRKVSFFPIPLPAIECFVQDKWQKDPIAARRIALLSHGSLAVAQMLVDQTGAHSCVQPLMQLHLPEEYSRLSELCQELEKQLTPREEGTEEGHPAVEARTGAGVDTLLQEIFSWFRDLHLLKSGVEEHYLYHIEALDFLKARVQHPVPSLETVLQHLQEVRLALQRHVKLRVVLEYFFLNT